MRTGAGACTSAEPHLSLPDPSCRHHQLLCLQVRPAPAVPDPIQLQYEALQQCMLVLRRAHLTGQVDAPVKALASAGLVDMDSVVYRDVVAAFTGIGPWLHYMEVSITMHYVGVSSTIHYIKV